MPDEIWKRKRRRKSKPEDQKVDVPEPMGEAAGEFSGWVNGKKASTREEMFARALRKKNIQFTFRKLIYTPYQIPGQNYEVDFILFEGQPQPIEIDDEWIHRTQQQQDEDALRDTILDDIMTRWGYAKIKRIKVNMEWTQEDFDNLVEEMY